MNTEKMIRAFVAIDLPEAVKAELGLVSDVLAGQMGGAGRGGRRSVRRNNVRRNNVRRNNVRWVKPALLHATVRFLGDTAVSQLPEITAALDAVAAKQPAFTLYLDGLGCFPNRTRPRVLWAGLRGEMEAARQLKTAVDAALEPLGWEREERPFRAHLTLGRVKDGRKLRGVEWGTEVKPLAVPVTAVHLIESQLRPDGPIYTIHHSSPLQQTG